MNCTTPCACQPWGGSARIQHTLNSSISLGLASCSTFTTLSAPLCSYISRVEGSRLRESTTLARDSYKNKGEDASCSPTTCKGPTTTCLFSPVHNGGHQFTRPTPGGPEVHQNRTLHAGLRACWVRGCPVSFTAKRLLRFLFIKTGPHLHDLDLPHSLVHVGHRNTDAGPPCWPDQQARLCPPLHAASRSGGGQHRHSHLLEKHQAL